MMQNLWMAGFADQLAWDLINNKMNPDLCTAVVLLSSTNTSNNSNAPSVISLPSAITTYSVISPLCSHSSPSSFMYVVKTSNGTGSSLQMKGMIPAGSDGDGAVLESA
jgi:hypothetical protein